MSEITRVFSGKSIGDEEIKQIKWIRETFPDLSFNELVGTVCEVLNWNTPAGNARIPQCSECLKALAVEGLIELPVIRIQNRSKPKEKVPVNAPYGEEVTEVSNITVEVAATPKDKARWKAYVTTYHALGYHGEFGAQLQYFIKDGDKELGCIQFSAAAWSLQSRDDWVSWNEDDRKARLILVLNNSRYLIYPWVNVKNLASKALSLVAKRVQSDWLRIYCYEPVLLETFVDTTQYKGTCYKAANWVYLGDTKGRGRMDRYNESMLSKKAIYLYPLQKDFRQILRGERPYKTIDPDQV
jgi:hypothetical protein